MARALQAAAFTHPGALRPRNEDTIAVGDWITSEPMDEPQSSSSRSGRRRSAWSPTAWAATPRARWRAGPWPSTWPGAPREATDEAAIAALLHEANDELFALMDESPAWRGMGTTVAGMAVDAGRRDRVQCRRQPGLSDRARRADPAQHRRHARAPSSPDGRTAMYTSSLITQVAGRLRPRCGRRETGPHVLCEPLADERALSDLQRRPDRSARPADDRCSFSRTRRRASRRCSRPPWRGAATTTSR